MDCTPDVCVRRWRTVMPALGDPSGFSLAVVELAPTNAGSKEATGVSRSDTVINKGSNIRS